MTDQSENVPPKQVGITVPENNKTITVPIGQVVIDGERRPINEAKVAELMESIRPVGILNPIVVVLTLKDGGEAGRGLAVMFSRDASQARWLYPIRFAAGVVFTTMIGRRADPGA